MLFLLQFIRIKQKKLNSCISLIAFLGLAFEARGASLSAHELQLVVENCTALVGKTLEESRTLAWETLASKAEKQPFTEANALAINGIGKLVADCYFSSYQSFARQDFFSLTFQYLDYLTMSPHENIATKLKSHARIWKALIIMRNAADIADLSYQDAWDLLQQAYESHATSASILWAAALVIRYNFNPNGLTRLEALQEAKNLLDRILEGSGTTQPAIHAKHLQTQVASQSENLRQRFHCDYINSQKNKTLYQELRQEQESQLQQLLHATTSSTNTSPTLTDNDDSSDTTRDALFDDTSSELSKHNHPHSQNQQTDANADSAPHGDHNANSSCFELNDKDADAASTSSSSDHSEPESLCSNSPSQADDNAFPPRASAMEHSASSKYRCDFNNCNKGFLLKGDLVRHLRTHTKERPFSCGFKGCNKAFSQNSNLKVHLRSHTEEKIFCCQIEGCNKTFKHSKSLKSHQLSHGGAKPFHCHFTDCNKAFPRKDQLQLHLRMHSGEKPFHCSFQDCGKKYTQKSHLKSHLLTHNEDKPFHCHFKECGKMFSLNSRLSAHLLTHNGEKPFHCHFKDCGKKFSQKYRLTNHLLTHKEEKPFPCGFQNCGKTFATERYLRKHKQCMHEIN